MMASLWTTRRGAGDWPLEQQHREETSTQHTATTKHGPHMNHNHEYQLQTDHTHRNMRRPGSAESQSRDLTNEALSSPDTMPRLAAHAQAMMAADNDITQATTPAPNTKATATAAPTPTNQGNGMRDVAMTSNHHHLQQRDDATMTNAATNTNNQLSFWERIGDIDDEDLVAYRRAMNLPLRTHTTFAHAWAAKGRDLATEELSGTSCHVCRRHKPIAEMILCYSTVLKKKARGQAALAQASQTKITPTNALRCKKKWCFRCAKRALIASPAQGEEAHNSNALATLVFDPIELSRTMWKCPSCCGRCSCARCTNARTRRQQQQQQQQLRLRGGQSATTSDHHHSASTYTPLMRATSALNYLDNRRLATPSLAVKRRVTVSMKKLAETDDNISAASLGRSNVSGSRSSHFINGTIHRGGEAAGSDAAASAATATPLASQRIRIIAAAANTYGVNKMGAFIPPQPMPPIVAWMRPGERTEENSSEMPFSPPRMPSSILSEVDLSVRPDGRVQSEAIVNAARTAYRDAGVSAVTSLPAGASLSGAVAPSALLRHRITRWVQNSRVIVQTEQDTLRRFNRRLVAHHDSVRRAVLALQKLSERNGQQQQQ